ncbi:cytochrome P450 94B3-like [Ananas comosus]|uniref:Cytochrome P450 94B3-like n=1 Tax=Ananas comosus TaxID=4615 RepID=A0A6P5G1A5_ANACO|nr:cytochrome P450 94B3-like [Ananas comosus]
MDLSCSSNIIQAVPLFLLLPLFLYLFFYLFFFHQGQSRKPIAHGLKSYPLLGHLPQFIKNRHRFLDWVTEIIVRSPNQAMMFHSPGESGIITANPSHIEHVLKTNFDNYPKGERSIAILEDFLGCGIFNSDGEQWRWQRKAASFEFNKKSLRNFVVDAVQSEILHRLLPLLDNTEKNKAAVDLQDVLERFAFDNICKVAFGEDPACLMEEGFIGANLRFMKAFEEAQNLVMGRFMGALAATWKIKKLLNIGSERQLRDSVSTVHDYAMKIILARKEKDSDRGDDILSRFTSNEDHTNETLRDIMISFLLAGRETTSSALTWFFWITSTRPDVEKKILEEIRAVRAANPNSGETFSFDELREMHYLHAAISESMRLHPPVPVGTLLCKEDDVLPDGTFVGKGWFVTYSAYAMGRSEDVWGTDCEEYKPERWLEKGVFRPESSFRYPVFHAGPRMCLGKEMAYIQMKSVVACVFERFRISVVGKESTPEHILSVTLRMKGGLPIQLTKRKD